MNPLVSDPVTQLSVHLIQALVRQDTARWKKFKDVSNEQSCIYRDFPVVWLYFHGDICDLWCWNIALEHDSHVPKWQSIGNFGGLMLGLSMDPIKSEINNIYMDNYIHEKPINLKCSCAPTDDVIIHHVNQISARISPIYLKFVLLKWFSNGCLRLWRERQNSSSKASV